MAQWAVLLSDERYEAERLFHHDTLELPDAGGDPSARPAPGDEVLVLARRPEPAVVALGRVTSPAGTPGGTAGGSAAHTADGCAPAGDGNGRATATLTVAYTRRCFDEPQPTGDLPLGGPLSPVEPAAFRALADRIAPPPDLRTWLVSVHLPIEADTPAEAVRRFWSYVRELGPRELPTFVSPADDELAMQAYVLGEQANLDPEEDEDD